LNIVDELHSRKLWFTCLTFSTQATLRTIKYHKNAPSVNVFPDSAETQLE